MNLRKAFTCLEALSKVTKNSINQIDLRRSPYSPRGDRTISSLNKQEVRLALFLADTTYPVLHDAIEKHGAQYDNSGSYREFVVNVMCDEKEAQNNDPIIKGLKLLNNLGAK